MEIDELLGVVVIELLSTGVQRERLNIVACVQCYIDGSLDP